MKEPQVLTGVILPNGELRLDEPIVNASGRVRVIVTECPFDSDDASPWHRLENAWSSQRARHFEMSEMAALKESKEAPSQESPAAEKFSPAAADLRDRMSQISEDCYCAGWLGNLEYLLWSAVMDGPVEKGNWNVTQSDIDSLRLLARRCGGWIVWDDVLVTKIWVPIEEWQSQYERHVGAGCLIARPSVPFG